MKIGYGIYILLIYLILRGFVGDAPLRVPQTYDTHSNFGMRRGASRTTHHGNHVKIGETL